jgi:hypothetical protein
VSYPPHIISLLLQVNMKDYAQYKNTFVKPKQSKAISTAIEEVDKYCVGRGEPTAGGPASPGPEEDEEEFDALLSGGVAPPGKVKAERKTPSRKREAPEAQGDSDSSASGPSSSTPGGRKARVSGRPALKERKTEEPSSTHSEGEARVGSPVSQCTLPLRRQLTLVPSRRRRPR